MDRAIKEAATSFTLLICMLSVCIILPSLCARDLRKISRTAHSLLLAIEVV